MRTLDEILSNYKSNCLDGRDTYRLWKFIPWDVAKNYPDFLEDIKDKISTSFIAKNADYLYRTGRVSKFVKDACMTFRVHPVLGMKNGMMKLKSAYIGDYEKAVLRYARKEVRIAEKIDKKRVFITHAACSIKLISAVKKEITKKCGFEQIIVSNASATISSNCGADTIGVLWVRN